MAKQRKIEEDREIEIKINGEILEWVPKYVYLRLAMATNNKLSKLKFLWNGQDPQTKLTHNS